MTNNAGKIPVTCKILFLMKTFYEGFAIKVPENFNFCL